MAQSSRDAIETIRWRVEQAQSYRDLFGPLPPAEKETQKKAVNAQYGYLVKLCHPDVVDQDLKAAAQRAFDAITKARDAAYKAIEEGTYDKPFTAGAAAADKPAVPAVVMRSQKETYALEFDPFATGDFSVLYKARTSVGATVLVKVATTPQANPWLENEARIVRLFHGPDAAAKLVAVAPNVPQVLDAFMVVGDGGLKYRVHVLPWRDGYVSLTRLMELYPQGMDPRDVAWVARRVLAQVMAAAMAGVVHTAITPDHVLVEPIKHDVMHIGWAHAIEDTKGTRRRVTHILPRWRSLYGPEVFAKEIPGRTLDIFMAGKVIQLLLGKGWDNAPKEFRGAVMKCTEGKPSLRYQTGKEAFDELTRVVRALWGSAYRPLVLPVQS